MCTCTHALALVQINGSTLMQKGCLDSGLMTQKCRFKSYVSVYVSHDRFMPCLLLWFVCTYVRIHQETGERVGQTLACESWVSKYWLSSTGFILSLFYSEIMMLEKHQHQHMSVGL